MTQEQLNETLHLHSLWLSDDCKGERADLSYADLSYANHNRANLSNADLSYADLNHADLSYANLNHANLNFADLDHADLSNANLNHADLRNTHLRNTILSNAKRHGKTIKNFARWDNLYLYDVEILVHEEGVVVKMGCQIRSLERWKNDFWNNPTEFPNDDSAKSRLRIRAFDFAVGYATDRGWIKNNKENEHNA